MKILQINKFFYPQGGSETYFFSLLKLLEKNGHQVVPFSMQHPRNQPSKYSKYFISRLDFQNYSQALSKARKFISNPEAAKKLAQLIKDTKPEIAHLHNIHHQLTPAIIPVLKRHKIPIVWTLHDYQTICPNYLLYTKGAVCQRCRPKKYYQCLLNKCVGQSFSKSALAALEMYYHRGYRDYLKEVDVLIAPSKFQYHVLKKWGIKNKIIQLYNFVDLQPLEDIKPKNYYLYFGRLSKEKGIDTLIKAFGKLPDKLIIAGTGPIKIKETSNIKPVGFKQGSELVRLIQESKAVIIPSEWYENNPLSALEALALRRPIIAAKIGGLPELTNNLFAPGQPDDLIKKIRTIRDPIRAISVPTPQQHYQTLLKIYEEAAAN